MVHLRRKALRSTISGADTGLRLGIVASMSLALTAATFLGAVAEAWVALSDLAASMQSASGENAWLWKRSTTRPIHLPCKGSLHLRHPSRNAPNPLPERFWRQHSRMIGPTKNPTLHFLEIRQLQCHLDLSICQFFYFLGFMPFAFAHQPRRPGIKPDANPMNLAAVFSLAKNAKASFQNLLDRKIRRTLELCPC